MEKAAEDVSVEERLRMHTLAQALVAFGQGIAFFHAGCDLLRSKSLDRDSYNSGAIWIWWAGGEILLEGQILSPLASTVP